MRGYEGPHPRVGLAELDELVGLDPVKQQVHEIAAQLRVARLRDRQGLASQPPVRHFVFTGPPGTGKTTVARILGHIFAALACWSGPRWSRRTGPTWSATTSGRPRSRPTGWSTRPWAGCCSSTRPTRCTTRGTRAATRSARRRCDAAQAGRGRPRPAGHRARGLHRRHGAVPAHQPRPRLPVQHPDAFPSYTAVDLSRIAGAGRAGGRCVRAGGAVRARPDLRARRAGGPDRRARQRPVRPVSVRARLRLPRRPRGPPRRGRHRGRPDHAQRRRRPRRLRRTRRLTCSRPPAPGSPPQPPIAWPTPRSTWAKRSAAPGIGTLSSQSPRATVRPEIRISVGSSGRGAPSAEHDHACGRKTRPLTEHNHGSRPALGMISAGTVVWPRQPGPPVSSQVVSRS